SAACPQWPARGDRYRAAGSPRMTAVATQPRTPAGAPTPASRGAPSATVVCCVEAGPLETTTLWMVESLRRWGGRFAQAPVIAVTPRFGPSLRHSTLRKFDDLHVQYVRKNVARKYSWYNFLNKPLSLNVAEEHAKTDIMVWLDADVFVTGAPEAFDL